MAVVFCVTGCFDRRELDTLGIVMGVAIDKAADEGEAELTVQLANPSGGKSSGAKSKTSKGGAEGAGRSSMCRNPEGISITSSGKCSTR